MTDRTRIVRRFDADVTAGVTDVQTDVVIPNGETWQLTRIVCAHADDGSHISGGFEIQWGSGGSWEPVPGTSMYLTGDTKDIKLGFPYTGDGTKRFRFIRINLDGSSSKKMIIIAEGFKRL